ncbi:MAG TPA: TetR/AcrR family transcriptional regulator [Xanthobacteraceae bacterium]|jgi:AcrR family transcriptional regulator|nr:TetR/AcrR family transcriptional regulator [Xanthobacteraceae bacterium]
MRSKTATKTMEARGKSRGKSRNGRAPEQTRESILRAAVEEFGKEGYGGARVDRISRAAGSNDRMLYYYFESKEQLFHAVIECCYADLVAEEEALDLDFSRPAEALDALIAFNWRYYWEHPEFLSILGSENLFEGRHVKGNIKGVFSNTQFGLLDRVLTAGVKAGVFKPDCDRFLVFMTILSLTYFYRSNLYTLSNYLAIDLAEKRRRAAWLAHVQKVVFDLVRLPAGASGAAN